MKNWLSENLLALLCQLILCLGGGYALLHLFPLFPGFPWVREYNNSSTTDYLFFSLLPEYKAKNDISFSPSAILQHEIKQLSSEQDILFVGDPKHTGTATLRWLVSYFAFPRRVVSPICNAPNELKHSYDPANLSAVIFFGTPPKLNITSPPVQILPGLEIRRLGGDERWQSFCLP